MSRKWIPLALLLLLVPFAGQAQETGEMPDTEAAEAATDEAEASMQEAEASMQEAGSEMDEAASEMQEPMEDAAMEASGDLQYGAEGYDWSGVVQQPRWILRLYGGQAQSGADPATVDVAPPLVDHFNARIDNGPGAGLALEWRPSCLIGLEPSIARYQLDSHLRFDAANEWLEDDEDVDLSVYALALNFHVSPKSPVDFYLGPVIALVDGGETTYSLVGVENMPGAGEPGSLGSVDVDWGDDVGYGVQLGLDAPASGGWAFNANVRYLDGITLEAGSISGLDVDMAPLFFNAGVAYRFGRDRGAWCGDPVALPPPPPPPAPTPAPTPTPPPPPPPAPEAPKEIRESCTFASGSARVDNICQAKLDEVALQMQDDPELDAEIVGYSDSTGAPDSNQVMSEQRAQAVSEYLVTRHGIDPNRITTEGRADQEPVASNDTPEGRAENRRAVIILTTE